MEGPGKTNREPDDAHNIDTMEDTSLDRTQFLLARLQELKAWQRDQEERLLRDQEEQMDQLSCLPLNQFNPNSDTNNHGLKGIEHANFNENMGWTDNIRRALDDGSCLNDDDDTIDQDLSSLTSFDGLHVIDVASNESQFSSSNTTLLGFEMHGSQIVPSQAGQISASGSGSQKLDLASTNMLQLPGWAKDTNLAILPDPITLNTTDAVELSQNCENPHQTEPKAIIQLLSNETAGVDEVVACGTRDIMVADQLKNRNMLENDKLKIAIEFDEKPVVPSRKTFEEMLKEQLNLEDQDNVAGEREGLYDKNATDSRHKNSQDGLVIENITPTSTEAKPFLRRGSGLARYGGIAGSPKGRVRRRSRPSISPMCQMKRSTSNNTVSNQGRDADEDKPRRVSTAERKMKHSSSYPKISNAPIASNKESLARSQLTRQNMRTGPNVNKHAPKSLKLKSLKKGANTLSEGRSAEMHDNFSNRLSQSTRGKMISPIIKDNPLLNDPMAKEHRTMAKLHTSNIPPPSVPNDPSSIKILSSMTAVGAYDSVELSFMEKLAKANTSHSRELEDLATFEMLEDKLATTDSSICSSISAIKIVKKSKTHEEKNENSPPISPILNRKRSVSDLKSATSTPLTNKVASLAKRKIDAANVNNSFDSNENLGLASDRMWQKEYHTGPSDYDKECNLQAPSHKNTLDLPDPVVNHNLMDDIKTFLALNNGCNASNGEMIKANANDHDTEEDDTLKDEIDGIPSDEDAMQIETLCRKSPVCQTAEAKTANELYDEQLSDDSGSDEINGNDIKSSRKNVRFQEKLEKEKLEALTFSPPRIPKSSPSYLIWSIFTREREERNRLKAMKFGKKIEDDEEWLDVEDQDPSRNMLRKSTSGDMQTRRDISSKNSKDVRRRNSESPMSRIPKENKFLELGQNDTAFQDALLNAKLVELNKEVEEFKKENMNMQVSRRRFAADKKQLAKDIDEFEKSKESEKKKLEEERKRLRREKAMFEKSQKEKKSVNDRKAQDEIDELQSKLNKLNEELNRKETKWAIALSKLQEQVKFLERENQQLHEDNHRLKLKGVSAKVSTHLVDPLSKRVYSATSSAQGSNSLMSSSKGSSNQLFYNTGKIMSEVPQTHSVDNGMRPESITSASPSPNNVDETPLTKGKRDNPGNPDERQMMAFSPAESLESDVTLVSGGMSDPISVKTLHSISSESDTTLKTNTPNPQIMNNLQNSNNLRYDKSEMITNKSSTKKVDRIDKNDEKVVKYYSDGSIEICCSNGHRKEISPDGKNTKVFYNNGDIKETLANGLVKYFYSGVKTWHSKYQDGHEVTQFHNGKTETKFPDGTVVIEEANGDSIILLPNGQKEEHTLQYKKREYPDGTVKIVYEDGRQETRYSSGRIRRKDSQGNLTFDSELNQGRIDNMGHNGNETSAGSFPTTQTTPTSRISSQITSKACMMNSF